MKTSFIGTIVQAGTPNGGDIATVTIETEELELKQMPMNLYGKTVKVVILAEEAD